MPLLQITRSNEYTNRLRNIKIFVDGKQAGVIKNNETENFELPAGNHTLKAKIDWAGSNTISLQLNEGETKKFELTSFAKHNPLGIFAAIYYTTMATNKYLNLEAVV